MDDDRAASLVIARVPDLLHVERRVCAMGDRNFVVALEDRFPSVREAAVAQ